MAKEVKEMTVEEKLKTLYELQQVDSKIDELRILAGELPQEVKDMSDEVEGLQTRLSNINAEIKDCDVQIADRKVKIDNAKAAIARYKEQQDNVRNNREFDNLSKEIEYQETDIELSQKNIRRYEDQKEAAVAEKDRTTIAITEKTADLNQKKEELDKILQETKAETDTLMLQAAELEKKVDERHLAAFKRIRKNAHNGLAVVKVERDSCGGCHAKVPAQRQLDIRLHKKIIVCEFCGRILVDSEMVDKKK